MKYIGLVMISNEDDVLEETLAINSEYVDAFYVLDGTVPNDDSRAICESFRKCEGYATDEGVGAVYGGTVRDGWRQYIYKWAAEKHGYDNWFLLLHGDEVWTRDPATFADERNDHYYFLLPFYFPREGEPWDDAVSPLEQLRWNLAPGYPEMRLFRGAAHVGFSPDQHSNVTPYGLSWPRHVPAPIKHYLYRSPDSQRARALDRQRTGFDPDNYRHILDRDEVYWTDEMIDRVRNDPSGFFTDLRYDAKVLA